MCATVSTCAVCNKGFYVKADGSCGACHSSCAECVGDKKYECLTCSDIKFLVTTQMKPGVEYESGKKVAQRLDNSPNLAQLLLMNFDMVKAITPAARILAAREEPS